MVTQKNLKVIWSLRALKQFKVIYDYIKNESPQGAETVRNAIIDTTDKLPINPLIFEADRFKLNNDKSYRAFTEFNIRVTYRINLKSVSIIKVIHTSQKPKLH